jgi:DNA-binding sugar fermentation-stimulating protein
MVTLLNECLTMSILLVDLETVTQGSVVKRPSKLCKTPYVADVLVNGEEILGHSLSLGCCGLVEPNANVLMTCMNTGVDGDKTSSSKKRVCSHRIDLSIYREESDEVVIGVNPKLGELIAEKALNNNCIANLQNVSSYSREVKIMNSRFDFAGIDETGKPFVLEIKNVPLADYVNVSKNERKKYEDKLKSMGSTIRKDTNKEFCEKIAYFPEGYRKKNTDVVSPRALKHIQELEEVVKNGEVRAILCFIVQRSDASSFQTSDTDLIYKEAVYQASTKGVEIRTIQVEWTKDGKCYFIRNDLPISLEVHDTNK